MIWGDFQSTFQLATGLNLAYYSVKELSKPFLEKTKESLDSLGLEIYRSIGISNILGRANQPTANSVLKILYQLSDRHSKIKLKLIEILESTDRAGCEIENGVAALAAAFISFLSLLYCSFNAEKPVEIVANVVLLIFITYAPIAVFLLKNGRLVYKVRRSITPALRSIDMEYYTKVMPHIDFVKYIEIKLSQPGAAEKELGL